MSRLRLAVTQNRGFVGACLLFAALFILYNLLHPRGFSSAVLIQNANESVAIAFVAMAQTIPVLLGGLDLSVGAVMTLANCIASELVHGTPAQIVFGMVLTLLAGAGFGLSTASSSSTAASSRSSPRSPPAPSPSASPSSSARAPAAASTTT